jgi:hypothetical protein
MSNDEMLRRLRATEALSAERARYLHGYLFELEEKCLDYVVPSANCGTLDDYARILEGEDE